MKTIVLGLITFYQIVISSALKQLLGVQSMCRYSPSCSEYARIAVVQHGVLRGSVLAFKRLLTCQPFAQRTKST